MPPNRKKRSPTDRVRPADETKPLATEIGIRPPEEVTAVLRRILSAEAMVAMDAMFSIRATSHLLDNTVLSWLGPEDLSTSRMHVLLVLWAADRPVPQMHVVRALKVSRATVSGLIEPLLQAGYLSSTPDESDRRNTLMALTPAGKKMARQTMRANSARLATALGGLSETDLAELLRLLSLTRASLAEHAPAAAKVAISRL